MDLEACYGNPITHDRVETTHNDDILYRSFWFITANAKDRTQGRKLQMDNLLVLAYGLLKQIGRYT